MGPVGMLVIAWDIRHDLRKRQLRCLQVIGDEFCLIIPTPWIAPFQLRQRDVGVLPPPPKDVFFSTVRAR